jgi:hypothetical protein
MREPHCGHPCPMTCSHAVYHIPPRHSQRLRYNNTQTHRQARKGWQILSAACNVSDNSKYLPYFCFSAYRDGSSCDSSLVACRWYTVGLDAQAPDEVARGLLLRTVGVDLRLIWTCGMYLKVGHTEIYDIFTGFLEAFCHYKPPTIRPHP